MPDHPLVNLPDARNSVIRLHPADNIAVARVPVAAGQPVAAGGVELRVREPIPAGHKLALAAIPAGAMVVRYGQVIGRAKEAIEPGAHVHVHNVGVDTGPAAFEFPEGDIEPAPEPEGGPVFLGYRREDGRAGTRNYIAVVAASNCSAYACELVAKSFQGEALPPGVDGVAAFPHGIGCGQQIGPDLEQLRRTLTGVIDHPNVAGAVLLGLGCEVNQIGPYLEPGAPARDRLAGFSLQDAGGTRAAVEAARKEVYRMMETAAAMKRVELPASKLMLGLECGGSDSFSGITANPALGNCSDRLVAAGGTAVLAETPETFGAEHLLVRRARSRRVAEKYLALVEWYKAYLRPYGSTFDDNPSPGNKEGGLTNILEKSLGAIAKGGTTPMMDAIGYAERVRRRGLVFMNTPGYDPVSMAGLAAGGANIMAFTTGRGSATGFPTVPVIKIATNSGLARRMAEDMDVNAGRIADGEASVEDVGREIFELMLRVASGERTASEWLGHNEFVPWSIGPVL